MAERNSPSPLEFCAMSDPGAFDLRCFNCTTIYRITARERKQWQRARPAFLRGCGAVEIKYRDFRDRADCSFNLLPAGNRSSVHAPLFGRRMVSPG